MLEANPHTLYIHQDIVCHPKHNQYTTSEHDIQCTSDTWLGKGGRGCYTPISAIWACVQNSSKQYLCEIGVVCQTSYHTNSET